MNGSLSSLFLYIFTSCVFSYSVIANTRHGTLKWGIAAAGNISQDFVNAMAEFCSDHQVIAIATRKNLTRAQLFAKKFNIRDAYAGYERLASHPDIDVVYIGNINPQHFPTAKLILESGKNVLLEKPLTVNRKQSEILTTLAEANNVFFAEGLWSRYLPVYEYIRQQIRGGHLGKIVRADAELGLVRTAPRYFVKELGGGGVILDLGVYGIDVMEWIFEEEPSHIKATGQLNDDGVDTNIQAEFSYSDNRKATLKLSITQALNNTIKIVGTKGSLEVPTFWYATSLVDDHGKLHSWPLPTGAKYPFINTNRAGLVYEANAVRKYVFAGQKQSDLVPHTVSLGIASVQDEIRRQIGVVCLTDCNKNYITPNLALPPK